MKYARIYILMGIVFLIIPFLISSFNGKEKTSPNSDIDLIKTNPDGKGISLKMSITKGKEHNHPTFAIWVEDIQGNYLQTLYVTKSLATGVYMRGEDSQGVWKQQPGEVSRPSTLPYYLHKRGINSPDKSNLPTPQNPIPDAYTGATPLASFQLETKTDNPLTGKIVILMEVNQPWDWNPYWNNTKYTDDPDYKVSCQPALIYAVTIDLDHPMDYYSLNPIGHSHYSGKDGYLYSDISTLTTALHIFEKIDVWLKL